MYHLTLPTLRVNENLRHWLVASLSTTMTYYPRISSETSLDHRSWHVQMQLPYQHCSWDISRTYPSHFSVLPQIYTTTFLSILPNHFLESLVKCTMLPNNQNSRTNWGMNLFRNHPVVLHLIPYTFYKNKKYVAISLKIWQYHEA